MKGILKRTAGTGSTFWIVTFPLGTDHLSDNSIFVLDRANLDRAASSLMVCREDEDKLTNEDYDTVVEFEIVEKAWENGYTFRQAKLTGG
jgi:hypothetical protein